MYSKKEQALAMKFFHAVYLEKNFFLLDPDDQDKWYQAAREVIRESEYGN